MKTTDQHPHPSHRYQVVPRTLVFLTSRNPQSGEAELLLLKGAPHKRLWANLYNGIGGHVEAGEDIYAAALREVHEETGLHVAQLALRGVVNIDTGIGEEGPRPGVMMFVFAGEAANREVQPTAAGTPEWIPLAALPGLPLVDDLHEVIPLALGARFFYGHYAPRPDGTLTYTFRKAEKAV
jgi:8-oxo-dGTP diphosphatase